ncbi:RNA polymerase sigma factor [Bacillus sp. DTU_2020_1000418_1_SI_GHA_SEK_038]|uniref:RNA polymerase sigma factor n=1 Tax=Bacillus sp. DTU_2020_1000418_1_SI_GHA_SEK_038 TaxID=3077585 RepID=UPI0028E972DB|nr:RNA polymerase sigma factor [Bacillus sp. DTU_2020_1000418_1_SI_GHA_SEK_038]WNS73760.1 RNA polymerase sigma factor [Bacillus sp. DTU_2020_1000418_1_SI_GHA_SEK_038]
MKMDACSIDMKEVCDLYYKRIFHAAYCITRDHYLAEDVVQETLLKAYQKMDTIQDKEKMGAWLSSIATRTAIDVIRKERKTTERLAANKDIENTNLIMNQNVEQEVELNFLNEQIHAVINSLSPDQKRVFLLKINYGLKEREIAHLMKLNQNTVKTKLYRIRKYLKSILLESELA